MHERNIFKNNKPNFEQLAQQYPDFARYVHRGSSGKPYINFKDPAALKSLSVALLKKYFDLELDIPIDRLIPTIPLRLNYIYWIEDLLELSKTYNETEQGIIGIDIGCGASCIYALLGNKMNQWKFVATEVDEVSCKFARQNIDRNKMQDQITVQHKRRDEPFFESIISEEHQTPINFTMCNPPFFAEVYDGQVTYNRANHRPSPASTSTATESERATDGGEVSFVERMIDESLKTKASIRWYTTMLGKKSSIKPLAKRLEEAKINNYTTTEFSQGRTTRWGLAWTFSDSMACNKLPKKPSMKKKKSKPFFMSFAREFFVETETTNVNPTAKSNEIASVVWDIVKIVEKELLDLQITIDSPEHIELMNSDAYELTGKAFVNTWIHSRQKRRKLEHQNIQDGSYSCLTRQDQASVTGDDVNQEMQANRVDTLCQGKRTFDATDANETGPKRPKIDDKDPKEILKITNEERAAVKDSTRENDGLKANKNSTEITNETHALVASPLFTFSCTCGIAKQLHATGGNIPALSFLCLGGNREQFHQLFLYLKNKLHGIQINPL